MGIFQRFKKSKTPKEHESVHAPAVSASASSTKASVAHTSDVILMPLISEKAATLSGANQYVFVVRKDANRLQVRRAIQAMYGVSPLSINILNVLGKQVRFGRKVGTRSDWKKAIITLPSGQTINVHEGV